MRKPVMIITPTVITRLACSAVIIMALGRGVDARAQIVVVSNANSSASINTSSPAGVSAWSVDGVNIMNQQSFLFRTDSGAASPISSIGAPGLSQPSVKSLNAVYIGPQFTLTTVFTLVGGDPGSGTADMSEQIKIQNTSVAPLQLEFFQFTDFTGMGNVQLGQNSRGLINEAFIANIGLALNASVVNALSPGANNGMVGDPASVMNDLLTVPGFTLAGPDSGTGATALEWDRTLGTNQTFIISEDLNATGIVAAPEPSAMRIGLAGLVLGGLVQFHAGRRRKAGSA